MNITRVSDPSSPTRGGDSTCHVPDQTPTTDHVSLLSFDDTDPPPVAGSGISSSISANQLTITQTQDIFHQLASQSGSQPGRKVTKTNNKYFIFIMEELNKCPSVCNMEPTQFYIQHTIIIASGLFNITRSIPLSRTFISLLFSLSCKFG